MNCGAPPKWYSMEAWNSNSEYLKPHCSASSSQRWEYSKMSRGPNKLFQRLKSIFCWGRLCQRQLGVSPKIHPLGGHPFARTGALYFTLHHNTPVCISRYPPQATFCFFTNITKLTQPVGVYSRPWTFELVCI